MAVEETNIANRLRCEASERGDRLYRNNRGRFRTLDGLRTVEAGLSAKGSSDLIGWTRVKITPDMVGDTLAVFTAREVKTKNGSKRSKKEWQHQLDFIDAVNKAGGIASVVIGD
jgi:ribosomal protein S19